MVYHIKNRVEIFYLGDIWFNQVENGKNLGKKKNKPTNNNLVKIENFILKTKTCDYDSVSSASIERAPPKMY